MRPRPDHATAVQQEHRAGTRFSWASTAGQPASPQAGRAASCLQRRTAADLEEADMTATVIRTRGMRTVPGMGARPRPRPTDPRMLDVARLSAATVLLLLCLLGLAGNGVLLDAGEMPAEGPAPGLGL
jgi:hypothetical protein